MLQTPRRFCDTVAAGNFTQNRDIMRQHRFGARSEHRQQEGQRVNDSATLADTFRKLKSLTVDLEYTDAAGLTKGNRIKYTVNIENAKSVFRFNCLNNECIRGDFDLSEELAKAVAAKRTRVKGELVCHGWRSKTTISKVRCGKILRYSLSLGY